MAKTVKIPCRYYQVREMYSGDVTQNIYDLRPWLGDMGARPMEEKCRNANNTFGRLEEQARFNGTEIYALNFMKMEDVSTTYRADIAQPAEHIDINVAANEYIAKNTVCLYDAENGIMMVQGNRGGYNEKSIQSYINSFIEGDSQCILLPIFDNINLMNESAEYLKLDIRLANYRTFEPTQGTAFESILDGMNRMEGINAHLEISLGRVRDVSLNSEQVRRTIGDLINNRANVTSAQIRLSDDQVSGVFDLFDNLCKDEISCAVNAQNGGIPFDRLASRLNDKYVYEHARERVLRALEQ